ncbi:glycoside hydrolase family 32 protein [Azotobacter chroococcum]|uniref:Glycoside hydrolase family 32 protein n=1 Tax=Azotobacter chroococcum TaxID=353 RepID=A0AA43Z639_9GAMM|nr:glycoside hydrolase family 32 protein [Azotobacter chroococcum]NHN76382.1 glycoside hydrolase family 32 protein [Azotobacter chroococcum]
MNNNDKHASRGRDALVCRRSTIRLLALAISAASLAMLDAAGASGNGTYQEPYRPQFHFSPAENWMNDPNGLVYHDGEYHLFYQYNPFGDTWGHMSWGHAVSPDLMHWEHLPVAIPEQGDEMVFSGSVVVDKHNTSGFGSRRNPPMVAIYTSARPGSQAQSLAYSTDRGRTWTRYAGNPVLDIGSAEFRDPKVFWYAPGRKWVMAVVAALEHKVKLYSSPDLKNWTHMSDFGPANATGGAWECPDLFPLPVDGDSGRIKWVLLVSLNPGSIAGGSGMQYFVGDFDGTTFRADNVLGDYTPPPGELYQGFEERDYGEWTTTGTAFGSGPTSGTISPQGEVSGYLGGGLVNSYHEADLGTGTLTSPPFTIEGPYLNFLVGGGKHPHDPAISDQTVPAGSVFADFEGSSYGSGWSATGTFAGSAPAAGTLAGQQSVSGYEGRQLVNTFIDYDNGTGTIVSPGFTVMSDYINFLVGGGAHPYPGTANNPPTAVTLVVDGEVVRTATGQDSEALNWTHWDVSDLRGQTARIEIVDSNTGGWGHINADHFMFSDEPALPRPTDTTVNLLIDGEVVRSTTGPNSTTLDWAAWNVRNLIGQTAQIQLRDRNTGGWGYILADHFMFADEPALSLLQRSSWVDYGKDFYAAITFDNVPDARRLVIGWMNNWNYGQLTPTSPWRGAMSVPREFSLRTIDGALRLVQQPVQELDLLGEDWQTFSQQQIPSGTTTLPLQGKAFEIKADLLPGDAKRVGLKVRSGNGEETLIGYDAEADEIYVDRTRSGEDGFSTDFPGIQRAPLAARDGKIRLHVLVDWSSVEVFGDQGQTVITEQIFPSATSDGVQLFSEGGSATLDSLQVRPLGSSWTQ